MRTLDLAMKLGIAGIDLVSERGDAFIKSFHDRLESFDNHEKIDQ